MDRKRLLTLFFIALPTSFLIGIWWGLYQKENQRLQGNRVQSLVVYAIKDYIPRKALQRFSKSIELPTRLVEFQSEEELLAAAHQKSKPQKRNPFDLIVLPSYYALEAIKTLDIKEVDDTILNVSESIHVDFRNLSNSELKKHFTPLSWGINGFLINKKKFTPSPRALKDFYRKKNWQNRLALMASPVELLLTMLRLEEVSINWIRTENLDLLNKALQQFLKDRSFTKNQEPLMGNGELWAVQLPNGRAQHWVKDNSDYRYFVPKEKATLWMSMIAQHAKTSYPTQGSQLIQFLLEPETNMELIEHSRQASLLEKHQTELSGLNGPLYLRGLQLSRIDFVTSHMADQEVWKKALYDQAPEVFRRTPAAIKE